ncbi:hypothetical protein [Streptomyces sp. NPDC026673]
MAELYTELSARLRPRQRLLLDLDRDYVAEQLGDPGAALIVMTLAS